MLIYQIKFRIKKIRKITGTVDLGYKIKKIKFKCDGRLITTAKEEWSKRIYE